MFNKDKETDTIQAIAKYAHSNLRYLKLVEIESPKSFPNYILSAKCNRLTVRLESCRINDDYIDKKTIELGGAIPSPCAPS